MCESECASLVGNTNGLYHCHCAGSRYYILKRETQITSLLIFLRPVQRLFPGAAGGAQHQWDVSVEGRG